MRAPRLPLVALLLVAAVAGLALRGPAPAAAQAAPEPTRVVEPFAGVVDNPCGEDVLVTGEVLLSTVVFEDARGGRHGTSLALLRHAAGVGVESGIPYRVVQLQHAGGAADGGEPVRFGSTEVGTFHLVGQGGATDLLAHGTLHFQTDAAGVVRATVEFGRAECRG